MFKIMKGVDKMGVVIFSSADRVTTSRHSLRIKNMRVSSVLRQGSQSESS